MGGYTSRYDTQPLPDSDGGGADGPPPGEQAKHLQMNWTAPQPPGDQITPNNPGGDQFAELKAHWPTYLSADTNDLRSAEQTQLDAAATVVASYNALWAQSEQIYNNPMWGQFEEKPPDSYNPAGGGGSASVYYQFTPQAKAMQQALPSILAMQRAALSTAAGAVTVSGGLIQLLNNASYAYDAMDQQCTFPDKSAVATGSDGSGSGSGLPPDPTVPDPNQQVGGPGQRWQ